MKEALGWDLENLKKQRHENEKWQECSRRKNEDQDDKIKMFSFIDEVVQTKESNNK